LSLVCAAAGVARANGTASAVAPTSARTDRSLEVIGALLS